MRTALVLFGILLIGSGRAAVYYVDVESGDDSRDGTAQASAWAHLPGSVGVVGSGWAILGDGDTVYVKGGTTNSVRVKFSTFNYRGNTNFDSIQVLSGHLATPAWGSGRAVFDEANVGTFGFWIGADGDCQGLTVDGFEIRRIASGGVGPGFDPNNGSTCIAVGGSYRARYIKIRRCFLHDALRNEDDRGHGIETDGSGGSLGLIVEYNLIGPKIGTKGIECSLLDFGVLRANYITGTGDHAIVVTGSHWDVCNNLIKMASPYVHDPVYAIKLNRGQNDVWNNILFQEDTPSPTPANQRANGFGVFPGSSSNRFYHNTVYNFANSINGREYGTGIAVGAQQGAVGNNDIQNNIAYRCRNQNGAIQIFVYLAATNTVVSHNNFYGSTSGDRVFDFGTAFYTAPEMNRAGPLNGGGRLAANRQAPPNFQGGPLPDGLNESFQPNRNYFMLTVQTESGVRFTTNPLTSPVANGFSNAPDKFARDILGTVRSAWSMGAYEFVGAPAPPANLRVLTVQ